jgi:hypothetical protein
MRVRRRCQSSSTMGDMLMIGCSMDLAFRTQLRRDGGRCFRERMTNKGEGDGEGAVPMSSRSARSLRSTPLSSLPHSSQVTYINVKEIKCFYPNFFHHPVCCSTCLTLLHPVQSHWSLIPAL